MLGTCCFTNCCVQCLHFDELWVQSVTGRRRIGQRSLDCLTPIAVAKPCAVHPKQRCYFRIKKTTRVCGLCFITEMILCWETYPLLTCHASHSTDSRTCAMTWCRCGSVALRSPAPARAASARCAILVRQDRPEANDEELTALSSVVSPSRSPSRTQVRDHAFTIVSSSSLLHSVTRRCLATRPAVELALVLGCTRSDLVSILVLLTRHRVFYGHIAVLFKAPDNRIGMHAKVDSDPSVDPRPALQTQCFCASARVLNRFRS